MKTTKLFQQANESFGADIEGVQYTIGRLTEIQFALSQSIDQALAEIHALFEPQRGQERDLSSYWGSEAQNGQMPPPRDPRAFNSLPQILEQMRREGTLKR